MSDGLHKWKTCRYAENERTAFSYIDNSEVQVKDCTYMIYNTPPRSVANRACSAQAIDCADCGVYKPKHNGQTKANKTSKPRSPTP